jgi:hypothetical protein
MKNAAILSPLEGEMSPKATEGVASEGTSLNLRQSRRIMSLAAALTPPDRPLKRPATLPSSGRGR